jgi:hypothetical protein
MAPWRTVGGFYFPRLDSTFRPQCAGIPNPRVCSPSPWAREHPGARPQARVQATVRRLASAVPRRLTRGAEYTSLGVRRSASRDSLKPGELVAIRFTDEAKRRLRQEQIHLEVS